MSTSVIIDKLNQITHEILHPWECWKHEIYRDHNSKTCDKCRRTWSLNYKINECADYRPRAMELLKGWTNEDKANRRFTVAYNPWLYVPDPYYATLDDDIGPGYRWYGSGSQLETAALLAFIRANGKDIK